MPFVYPTVVISGTTFNVYISNTDADTYFKARVGGTAYTGATEDAQNAALVTACNAIDRQPLKGAKTDAANSRQFPRTGLTDRNGVAVDSATLPQDLKDATCELALYLLEDEDAVQDSKDAGKNVKRVRAGDAEAEFFRPTSGGRFPQAVQELLGAFLAGATTTAGSAYGTDEESQFQDDDRHDLGNPLA